MHVCNANVSKSAPDGPDSMTWYCHAPQEITKHSRAMKGFSVVYLCLCVQAASRSVHVEVRGQLTGVDSILPHMGHEVNE